LFGKNIQNIARRVATERSRNAMNPLRPGRPGFLGRTFADAVLFGVTALELAWLFPLTPRFTIADWIYVLQHVLVLVFALARRPPGQQDHSLAASAAVAVAYTYPYAQVACLKWLPGEVAWYEGGLVLVTLAAFLSLASLLSLGLRFGVRPAMRGLATGGPYRLMRHPMYLAYVLADIGYNLEEWNDLTVLLVIAGWASLLYRIRAEERVLARHGGWTAYAGRVRYRLVPGVW
jgi:protein-S-isoprenylcysteine O-methyltransferase Ste14